MPDCRRPKHTPTSAPRRSCESMPLHGPSEAVVVARLLAWLASEENTHVTGQVVFVDGGADVFLGGPRIFG